MARRDALTPENLRAILRRMLSGPQVLAFLPAMVLGAFWIGGEGALVIVALGVPLLVLLAGGFERLSGHSDGPLDPTTQLPLQETLQARTEDALTVANVRGLKTAFFLLQIEDLATLRSRFGSDVEQQILKFCADRLRGALREGDVLGWMGEGTFGICLRAVANFDLERAVQLATRLQDTVEEPISLGGPAIYVSSAVGFCLSNRAPAKSGVGLRNAAAAALDEAHRNGPSAIRAYSSEMEHINPDKNCLRDDALRALENGEIEPWFQPQVSTDTGRVSGFEALARWTHPQRGVIPASDFIPIFEQSGQLERLGEVILTGSLKALSAWDKAGLDVPSVSVNFTGEELRNPRLVEKIRWDLDRFDLAADRLTIEVLETVVVGAPEDTATQNIFKLSEMGCKIDLDDFGTGHASISAIHRFAVQRIKIDRSFVTHVDSDAEQRRMVSAILTMAEQLGLETLGEGVETAGEHAMLGQLGCSHVQGYGIARPMPFVDTLTWLDAHQAKLIPPPPIGRKSG